MQTEKFLLKMNDASEIAVNRWIPESEEDIKAVIVFSHGMQEHSLRYDRIGSIFAENGFVFNAHDHRGHGKTAQNAEQNGTGMFGKLADKRKDTQSSCVGCNGMTDAMVTVETASTSSETTKKNKNKACQGNHVSKTPEIIGPTAKAEPMTNPAVPITRPRSL